MSRNDYSAYSLVVGRFQPLHNGHMEVLCRCASESEHLVVGIGSAQYSHHPDNPFTAGERYLMIHNALEDEGITNYSIVPMEDLNRYSVWVAHVVSMSPPFKRVYTNNPLTKRLFQEAGFEVRNSPLYNREVYSGTEIRRRIVADEEWRSLVPDAVAEVIDDIDGVGRLKDISGGGDNAPL
ncbi:MAG: nicotinamide-nucleotide adenylyltransferase [Candidatus Methanomethylophilaceae archaeon]